ncbi:MAG TPA: DoxX family protein [Dongiaceae bacterium]|jgi:putative oxidoreductase|nr:DoxX family protein [Dongiaceae bacterium]
MMSALPAAGPALRLRAAAIRGVAILESFPLALLQLVFRLGVASVFWHSGQAKIASWQSTLLLFANEYRLPVLPPGLAATLAASFELGCSTLIALGLLTRLATLPLLAMVLVIQAFVYPENWVEHLTWAAMLVFLLTRGPGPISLDRLLATWLFGCKAS